MNENNLVSGYEFHCLAKWSICPRYPIKYDPNLIEHNDIIFLNLDCLKNLIVSLQKSPPKNKFILITHNSDKTFTEKEFNLIKKYVVHIYAINSNYISPIVTNIPLGFVDNKYKPHIKFTKILNKNYEKNILIYMNFTINTNPNKRNKCYNTFENCSYVFKENNIPP